MDRDAAADVKRQRPVYHSSLSATIPSPSLPVPSPPDSTSPSPRPQTTTIALCSPSSCLYLVRSASRRPLSSLVCSLALPSLALPPPSSRSVTTPLNSPPPVGPPASAAGNSYPPASGSQAYPDARAEHGNVIRSPRTPGPEAVVSRPSTSLGPRDYSPPRRRAPPHPPDWAPAAAPPITTKDGSAVGVAAMTTPRPPHPLPYGQPPMDPAVNGLPVHMAYRMQPPEQL